MFKKFISTITLSIVLLVSLFPGNIPSAHAQTVEDDLVTFATLGQGEILLNGPVDSQGIDFNIPADWSLTSGSVVHLNLRAFIGDNSITSAATAVVAYVEVYLNGNWLDTIPLTQNGEYSVDVNIPPTAWRSAELKLPQSLRIYLHDALRCSLVWTSAGNGNWRGVNVAVSQTSYLFLPHQNITIPTDLKMLPYPVFQDSFQPDKAIVIVPDQPTESELQAAFIVEAAFARITDGKLATTFTTAGKLDQNALSTDHAIFVGHASAFPQLAGANLPLPANGDTFDPQKVQPEDGVLQLVPSPVAPSRVWLLVSGDNGDGIVKAAQAIRSGMIRTYGPSNLAIVTAVQPQPIQTVSTDVTLSDLGYDEQSFTGYGLAYFSYWFDVSPEQIASDGAYFDMVYNNSALLNFDESGVSILLNGQFVGSARFNDRTTESATARFNIPSQMFQAGRNLLLLEANLSAMTPCIPIDQVWISIKPQSAIHVPFLPAPDTQTYNYDLTAYPQLLFPTFNNLGFIVSRNDPASWAVAANTAYDIGKITGDSVIKPAVAYADSIPNGFRESNSHIIIGRASQMPILQDLSQILPAPFQSGSDIATEKSSEFSFQVPESTPVGYLQVLPSPWNNKHVILAILGNSDQGLQMAGLALTDRTIRSQIVGNLAIMYNNQVIVDNVSTPQVAAPSKPTVLPQTTLPAFNTQNGPFNVSFVSLGLGVLGVIVLLGLVSLLVSYKKKKAVK